MDNTFIEAFNGRLRDECLNRSWFLTLADARRIIAAWRLQYGTARPRRASQGSSPSQLAEAFSVNQQHPVL
jgi:putative transposase